MCEHQERHEGGGVRPRRERQSGGRDETHDLICQEAEEEVTWKRIGSGKRKRYYKEWEELYMCNIDMHATHTCKLVVLYNCLKTALFNCKGPQSCASVWRQQHDKQDYVLHMNSNKRTHMIDSR